MIVTCGPDRPGRQQSDDRVAGLVVGDAAAIVRIQDDLALGAENDLLQRVEEVLAPDVAVAAPGREQRRLVDEVAQVRAHQSRRGRGDLLEVDGVVERHAARVDAQDLSGPTLSGGCTTTRRSKRPGRSRAGSRTSGRLVAASTITPAAGVEAVHLDEELIERLLALVVAAE